jgi:hypothetical protein
LWPVLARGLSKDRRHRTPTAHALGVALARWLIAQGETEDACGEPLAWNWELNDALDQVEFAPTNPDRDAIRGRARRSPVRSGFRLRPPANSSWGMIARAAAVCAAAPAIALFVSQSMKDGPAVLGVAPRESAAIASGIGPVVKTDAPALGNPPLAAARREATLVAASAFAPQSLPAEASDDETPAAALTSQEAQVAGLAGTEAHSNLKAPAVKASKRSSASRAHESTKRSRAREAALGLKDPF